MLAAGTAQAAQSDPAINVMQAAQLASIGIGEAATQSLEREQPQGWRSRELPGTDFWVDIRVRPVDDPTGLGQEVLVSLDGRERDALYCDNITRGYQQDGKFISAWQVRNLVWVVRDEALEELLSGEPWTIEHRQWSSDWPQGMTRAAFERIIEHSTKLQAGELHIFCYSEAGDRLELDIEQLDNRYRVQAMLAPELPLAGSLLKEIDVDTRRSPLAALTVQARPGALGWLDPFGNTVVLAPSRAAGQEEK
ncbi:MAG: hypothetical protein R3F46_04960 [bacterium]